MKTLPLFCIIISGILLLHTYDCDAQGKNHNPEQFVQSEVMVRLRPEFMDRTKAEQIFSSLNCDIIRHFLTPEESITFNSSLL